MKYLWIEDFNDYLGDLIEGEDLTAAAPKLIYCGVNYVNNSINEVGTIDEAKERIDFIQLILALIEQITPGELLKIFPLEERYKVLNSKIADYDYSLKYIKEYGIDSQIEDPLNLLWHFNNKDTGNFVMNANISLINFAKLNGANILGETIVFKSNVMDKEEYIKKFKAKAKIGSSRIHRNPNGQTYLINKKGKKIKLKKQYPGYLKPI